MPTYNLICTKCNHEWERILRIKDMDIPLSEECPECKELGHIERRIYGSPMLGDPFRMGIKKVDSEFRDKLQQIHNRNPGSTIAERSTLANIR